LSNATAESPVSYKDPEGKPSTKIYIFIFHFKILANTVLVAYTGSKYQNGQYVRGDKVPVLFTPKTGKNIFSNLLILKKFILGVLKELTNFKFDKGTGISGSCSVTFMGKLLIFGGSSYLDFTRQISEIKNCKLQLKGQLPFDSSTPACTVLEGGGRPYVLICFVFLDSKSCHR